MKIAAISISDKKGVRKENVPSALLKAEHGIEKDAHAGTRDRQVSLLARESIDKMVEKGLNVTAGDFAENITTAGIDLTLLSIGQLLCLGDEAIVEVSQIGKECHDRCAIYHEAGDCVMPKEGIFVKVLRGGTIHTGDPITIAEKNRHGD